MDRANIGCNCFADGKVQDTKCESVAVGSGSLSVYKVYCAACNTVLDIVYHGITGVPIVSLAATS